MGTRNSRPNSRTSIYGAARGQRPSRSRKWRWLRPQVETVEPRILLSTGVVSSSRNKAHAAILAVRAVPAHAPAPLNKTAVKAVSASRPVAKPAETAYHVPGQPGETIKATFALQDRNAAFRNEFGLFLVDDASGKIGKLKPGDRGYARAALKNRITVFTRDQNAWAITNITLPGGRYFGTYLIQNSTAAKFLARNPLNQCDKLPKAFFSFTAANPDHFTHVKAPVPNVQAWEDMTHGGDRDYNDAVVSTQFLIPASSLLVSAGLAHDTAPNGQTNADGITSDPTIAGTVGTGNSPIKQLLASVDTANPTRLVDVTSDLSPSLAFKLDPARLGQIHGGPLADGPHTVRLEAVDVSGQSSRVYEVPFTLDTHAPVIVIQSPASGLLTNQDVPVTGTVTDATSIVVQIQDQIDARAYSNLAFDKAGSFHLDPGLSLDGSADGTHVIKIEAQDIAGNVSAPLSASFILDATKPVVTVTQPTGSPLTNQNLTVAGVTTGNLSGVQILKGQVDGGSFFQVPFDAAGNFSLATTLPLDGSADGPHTLQFRATDKAGNVSGLTPVTFTLDTTPPLVSFDLDPSTDSAPVGDQQTTFNTVILAGQTEPGLPVKLVETGATTTADAAGKFSFANVPLVVGANPFHVQATDPAGNVGEATNTFTLIQPQGGPCVFNDLTGWTTSIQGGTPTGQGTIGVQGDRVVLREGDSFRVALTRTYDSLTAGSQDQLGYGWRLEFRDTDLRTSVRPTTPDEQEAGIYNAYRTGSKVYITMPGGKREGFTFEPVRKSGFAGYLGFYDPVFVPDRGVTSKLSVNGATLMQTDDGSWIGLVNGGDLAFNPADPNWGGVLYLTTKDGLAYTIDASTGLLNAVGDANGNALSFTDTSIDSNRGVHITFGLDPQGRIIAAHDPAGNTVKYQYNAGGDLVAVTDRNGNVTTFVYDAPGHPHYLTKVIDPLGRTGVRTEYDAQGRLISLIDANGKTVQLAHDPADSLETVTDALGNPTTFEYDPFGNVVKEVDANGSVTTRTYDDANNMLTETDPLGHTTTYTYDGSGNVLTTTDPLGNVTANTYITISPGGLIAFAQGARPVTLLASTTDPQGHTTKNGYDGAGNLISTTDAAGNVTKYAYDSAGNQTSITDAAGKVSSFTYDASGHMLSQTDALGHVTTYTYDANGDQLTQTTTVSGQTVTTSTTYDASGHPTSVTDAEGHTTTTQYDALGRQIATIDALGHKTSFVYDARGELIETDFADGTKTTTTYDDAGHRIASTDRAGRTTGFVYDALGRLVETDNPDGTKTTTTYDDAGEVTAQTDELGHTTTFTYDAAGRQTAVTDALGDKTTTTYDTAAQRVATTDALGHTTSFAYDAVGRLTSTVYADGTTTSTTYDVLGRSIAQTDQLGRTTHYGYDDLGRLTGVLDAMNQHTVYAYDEAGDLITQTDANGHVTSYEYDLLGRKVATVLPMGQRSTTTY